MSKANKRGFTLVEIIITLAIIITITTVAIGSYIGISDKKKKEEWKLVKDQIETAAEQYFSSNKYLYEGLTDGVKAYISVGTLVKSDYLNKVVNPTNKKEVPACSLVEVEIKNGKYVGTYDDNEDKINCNTTDSSTSSNKIIVKEKNSTSGAIHYYNKDGNELDKNNWFNIDDLGESTDNSENNDKDLTGKVLACIDVADSAKQKDAAGAVIDGTEIYEKTGDKGFCKILKNGTDKDIAFKLINSSGRTYQVTEWVGVDTTRPTGYVVITSTKANYNSYIVNVRLNASDATSHLYNASSDDLDIDMSISGNQYSEIVKKNHRIASSLDGSTRYVSIDIEDEAGNGGIAEGSYTVYKECSSYCTGGYHHSSSSTCSYNEKKKKWSGSDYDTTYSEYYDRYTGKYCSSGYYSSTSCSCTSSSCRASTPSNNCPNIDPPETVKPKPNPTPKDDPVEDTKAYHWKESDYSNCSKNGAPGFKNGDVSNGGTKDVTGPWRRYTFTELECSCSRKKDGTITGKVDKDITDDTHPKSGTPKGNHAYIIYKTVDDCKNNTANVKQVCLNGLSGGHNGFHGVKWNVSDSNWKGKGWYNLSYTSKTTKNYTSNQACEWACKKANK